MQESAEEWRQKKIRSKSEQMPTMFVAVESIDEYIEKAQKLGAKVVKK